MFVILLKWWKRRVGGKDYRLCFYRKVNIRLMTPNCAPSCYKAFRNARDEVMRLIRSAKVGSLILPTMLAPLFEHAIRSPFSDRLPSAAYITLIGSGWRISLDFNLGQVAVTITTIGTCCAFVLRLNTPYPTRCYVTCTKRSTWLSSL